MSRWQFPYEASSVSPRPTAHAGLEAFPVSPAPAVDDRSWRPQQGHPTDPTLLPRLGASSSAFPSPSVAVIQGWALASRVLLRVRSVSSSLPQTRLVSDTVFHQESEAFLLLYKLLFHG